MRNSRSRELAILLAPPGEAGARLLGEAQRWLSAGIIEDFVWVRSEDLEGRTGDILELPCRYLGDQNEAKDFDLFQYLGTFQISHLDLVVPWFLADQSPSVDLAKQGIRLKKAISRVMPKPSLEMRQKSKQLFATLLSIPSAMVTSTTLPAAPINYRDFELNVLVSPESRAEPWTPSAPIRADENFALFALAQIASIAGVWSGAPLSVSALLQRQGFNFSQGNVVMLRAMASLVVAQGVASRMITEALESVANPDIDPYKISSQTDLDRPESIAELNDELIRGQIEARVSEIILSTDSAFVYDGPKKPTESDYTRLPKEAWIFFWKFTRDVVVAMPHHARDWVINKYGELTNALLKNVREPVPEKYLGLDKELRERLSKILEFRADRATQDALAISATAFQQMPQVWEKLRSLAFGALDGSDSSDTSRKPLVFPSVDYVAANPDNRFLVDPTIKELLSLEMDQLAVDDVSTVREAVSKLINESNSNLDLMRKRLAAFENGTILLEEPNAPSDGVPVSDEMDPQEDADSNEEVSPEPEVQTRKRKSPTPTLPKQPSKIDLVVPTFVNDRPLPVEEELPAPHIEVDGYTESGPAETAPESVETVSESEPQSQKDETSTPIPVIEEQSPEEPGAVSPEEAPGVSPGQKPDAASGEAIPGSALQGLLEFANEVTESEPSNTQLTSPSEDEVEETTKRKISIFKRRRDSEGEV